MALQFNDENFQNEVLTADQPVLVDFYADWCGPCKMLAPIIEDLYTEFSGKVKIGKLNVDASPVTAAKYNVQSIPTLILFKDGQAANTIVGAQPKAALVKMLNGVVNP